MNSFVKTQLLQYFNATDVFESETIQSLWSDYGTISRWRLTGAQIETVIVKHICFPEQSNHPRGWNSNTAHLRKVKSYEVELEWYRNWAIKANENCRVPLCYFSSELAQEKLLVLEDLDAAGYELRRSHLEVNDVKVCLKWLANFHGKFMKQKPTQLWNEGSYWHLETRPDELLAMESSWLKDNAKNLAEKLKNCNYQTLIHGDAKVANFCFSPNMDAVAAVDFQYVGGGCGMKDVAYFLGSCLTENTCELYETELLEFYFQYLMQAIKRSNNTIDIVALEQEWRYLYSFAWADFSRFLLGWMPTHPKLNGYSKKMVEKTFLSIKEDS